MYLKKNTTDICVLSKSKFYLNNKFYSIIKVAALGLPTRCR